MRSPTFSPPLRRVRVCSRMPRRLTWLLVVVVACGLLACESDARAQFGGNWDLREFGYINAVGITMLAGLPVATFTLDTVQAVQLGRRGHTSLGVTVPNLVFSVIEFVLGACGVGLGNDQTLLATSSAAMAHGALSITWSIYGIARTGPRVAGGPPGQASQSLLLPSMTLLPTPSGAVPGIGVAGRF
jgi:hypothetical protein